MTSLNAYRFFCMLVHHGSVGLRSSKLSSKWSRADLQTLFAPNNRDILLARIL